jgi:hypothetical protein
MLVGAETNEQRTRILLPMLLKELLKNIGGKHGWTLLFSCG